MDCQSSPFAVSSGWTMIVAVRLNFVIFNPYFIIFACVRGKHFFPVSRVLFCGLKNFISTREPKEYECKILIWNRVHEKEKLLISESRKKDFNVKNLCLWIIKRPWIIWIILLCTLVAENSETETKERYIEINMLNQKSNWIFNEQTYRSLDISLYRIIISIDP